MSIHELHHTEAPLEPMLSLLAGPGGTRVITASAISYALFDWAGITLDRVGGVSGGAPAAAIYASGMPGKDIVKLALDLDFGRLVTFHLTAGDLVSAVKEAWLQWRAGRMPKTALISTLALGEMVKEKTKGVWPAKFWTVALTQDSRIVFTAGGIWEIPFCGPARKLSDKPAPIEIAIAATTAIPGIMHGVPLKLADRDLMLFDGGLTVDALSHEDSHRDCPIDLALALYGRHKLFVFDVGPDLSRIGRIIAGLRRRIVNTPAIPPQPDLLKSEPMITLIDCPITDIHTLKLGPSRDMKWSLIMKGFDATVTAMEKSGLLSVDKLAQAKEVSTRHREIAAEMSKQYAEANLVRSKVQRSKRLKEIDGFLSRELEALLHAHGLF